MLLRVPGCCLQIYTIFQTLVLSHCKHWNHVEALWFAGIANAILWWTFVKACVNAVAAKLGAHPALHDHLANDLQMCRMWWLHRCAKHQIALCDQ